jgi:hypothetical protein
LRKSESPVPSEPEKAQIFERADDLYREIRIENSLTDEDGKEVGLKNGAEIEVTVEADKDATTLKNEAEVIADGSLVLIQGLGRGILAYRLIKKDQEFSASSPERRVLFLFPSLQETLY